MPRGGEHVAPPPDARKVPGMRVWITKDAVPYGLTGRLKTGVYRGQLALGCQNDDGTRTTRNVSRLVAEAWMEPQPPRTVLKHIDGDRLNCNLDNLAWVAVVPREVAKERWRERVLRELAADPNHPMHGESGYTAGCRCRVCRNGERIASRKYKTRKLIREIGETR